MSELHRAQVLHGQYPPGRENQRPKSFREYSSLETKKLVQSMASDAKDSWIAENVKTIEYNNTTVVMVDHDTVFETHMNNPLRELIHSPKVDGVVVEYFSPELHANVKNIPIVGSYLASKVEQPRGKANTDPHRLKPNLRRLNFAKELSESLASSGKAVSCVDIANKPSYMAIRELWTILNMGVGALAGRQLDKRLPQQLKPEKISFEKIGINGPLMWRLANPFFQIMRKGIYDVKQINILDKVQLHMEDARRLIAAAGLKQKIDRERVNGKHSTLLLIYPKAHTMRIRNYMEQMAMGRPELSTKVKDMAYRLVSSPLLDLKERIYAFKNGAWSKTQEHHISSLRAGSAA